MNHSLFISDLHLCDSRPHITQAFIHFLANIAIKADALYILGDLFEYWAGDDIIEVGGNITATQQPQGLSPQNIPAKAGYSCVKPAWILPRRASVLSKNKARFNCSSPYNALSLRKPISVAVFFLSGYLT